MKKGYKKKPFIVLLIAFFYLLNPILNIYNQLFFSSKTFTPLGMLYLTWLGLKRGNIIIIANVFLWISSFVLIYGIYNFRKWAYYFFFVHAFLTVLLGFFSRRGIFNITTFTLINLIFLIPIFFFVQSEIKIPFFNPHLRWWEQEERILHIIKVIINNTVYPTYDLSASGAFIIIDTMNCQYKKGDIFDITLELEDNYKIKCKAQIRWLDTAWDKKSGIGFGVKFLEMSKKDKNHLKKYIRKIIKEGKSEVR